MERYPGSSQLIQNKNLKQSDIRNMLLKSNNVMSGTQDPTGDVQESHLFNSEGLIIEMSNYLSIRMSVVNKRCNDCPNNIDCGINNIIPQNTHFNWNQVDDSILDTVTAKDLIFFSQSLNLNLNETCLDEFEFKDFDVFHNLKITQLEKINKLNNSSDLDSKQLEGHFIHKDTDTNIPLGETSFAYQAPKTLDLLLSKYSMSMIGIAEISQKKYGENNKSGMNPDSNISDNSETINNGHKSKDDDILHFFKLNSLVDLFSCENVIDDSQETVIYSPDIFDNSIIKGNESVLTEYRKDNYKRSEDEPSSSPVLCKFERVRNIKQFQKNIFNEFFKEHNCREKQINIPKSITTPTMPNLEYLHKRKEMNHEVDIPSKFTMDIIELSNTSVKKPAGKDILTNHAKSNYTVNENSSMLNLCSKIITEGMILQAELNSTNEKDIKNNLDDICDLSIFGVSYKTGNNVLKTQTNTGDFPKIASLSSNFDVDEFCDLTTFRMGSQETNQDMTVHKETENVTTIDNSKKTYYKNVITKLDTLVGKQDSSKIDKIINNKSDEMIIELPNYTKENYYMPLNKSYSQSQMPITQILSLVNKNEKEMPKNMQITTSQRNNTELNKNHIWNNDFFNYENCNHNNKGKDLLIKDTFYNKNIFPNTSKLFLSGNQTKEIQSLKIISLNKSFSSSNSDDDFEEKQNHAYIEKNIQMNHKNRNPKLKTGKLMSVKKTKNCNIFIDDEAELSVEDVNISEDEEDQGRDMYEISFIADETQNVDTQMHAQYLQSLRNPRKCQFKIPPRKKFEGNVCSQEVNHKDDTYLDDTFVVHDGTESPQFELSELEILEQELKEIKRNKRKTSEDMTKSAKRRRIIHISSDDSD